MFIPGAVSAPPLSDEPGTIKASFGLRSYAPGSPAVLTVQPGVAAVSLRVFHCGPPAPRSRRDDELTGVAVGEALRLSSRHAVIRVGDWPSGLYFVRLDAPGGRWGF